MKKPELLAPAGTYEKAKIAFMYGADAVYCGTSNHSLRTRTAMDFTDLKKTVELAHGLGKRVHVALNIYARDDEYEGVIEEVKELAQIGIDGFIVADPGVVDVIKEYASIPSRDGLLTMIAAGMMKYARDLAIAINMYAEEKEKNN
jgi:putative protease